MTERGATSKVTLDAQAVLDAGRLVKTFLGNDRSLPFALNQLEAAAERHETGVDGLVSLGFAELELPHPANEAVDANEAADANEAVEHDLLVSVLADLDVAGVLLAAGQASGDGVAARGDPLLLDRALDRLSETTRSMAAGETAVLQLGFGEPEPPKPEPGSANLQDAADRLRQRTSEVLSTLSKETGAVAGQVVTALRHMAPQAVTDAIEKLGDAVPAVPKTGRLIGRGLRILSRALQTLSRLVGVDVLAKVRAWVGGLWARAQQGTLLEPALGHLFGSADTMALTSELIGRASDDDKAALDRASSELGALTAGFSGVGGTLKTLVSRVAVVTGLAFVAAQLFPPVAPWVAPAAALAYVLVLAVAVVVGMDYADTGFDRGHIAGARRVLERIAT